MLFLRVTPQHRSPNSIEQLDYFGLRNVTDERALPKVQEMSSDELKWNQMYRQILRKLL